tara:strand:+ start:307 stop:1245 length:939 start_codon:yes stop_codon:yes gene_type:complete
MKPPFFSVVIPTYNQASFLKDAIRSVINQNFKNYEIIIIDNNSKDDTKKTIKCFNSNKIIYRKINNKGIISKSRNHGIKTSRGKWIAFLDSDDFWYKNKLKEISKITKKRKKFDLICNDEIILFDTQKNKKIWRYGPYKQNFYENLLRYGNCISTSASIVRKDFLEKNNIKFDENKKFVTTEDYDFFLNIARKNGKFYFLHKVLGNHLIHKKSASSNYLKHKKALESVSKHHVFNLQKFYVNKKELWKDVNYNIGLENIIHIIKEKKMNYFILEKILKLFIKSPIKFLRFFILQSYKALFKKFDFYFYFKNF